MSKINFASYMGTRHSQEDHILWADVPEGVLIGILDGHGGDEVASLLAHQMPRMWSAIDGDAYEEALRHVFAMAHAVTKEYRCGSTASVVFIPKDETEAYIAVLGDSPVLAERADGTIFVGPDHNARSNQEERSKAVQRGGIYQGGYMWNDYGDNAAGLQMTRAFGDHACRNFLGRTPEIFRIPLGNFLLVASDGMFDPKHTSREAVDDVLACIRNDQTADQMCEQAVAKPTNDNVSAILWRRE